MAWLTGFSNRLKLTIPPDNVDSNQTDFPVMIYLSTDSGLNNYDASAVFDELSTADQKRIAVTTNDEITQCPVEIEYWDSTEEKAILWTKIPTVYSTVDTDMYLYFDATYSGTTVSGNTGYVGDMDDTTYQMVVDIGDEGTYDTNLAYYPCVIKESDTSYKMWYSGYDSTNDRILYATSTDGISWTGHQLVMNINNISYDATGVLAPHVIKESDSSYKMWYSGLDVSSNYRICYAISDNGTTWSGHQMVIDIGSEGTYDTTHAHAPHVIKESDTSYKMWYSGLEPSIWRILYATSTNGTSWSNYQMVINIGVEGTYDTVHVFAPHVIKESDTSYRVWYAGNDGSNWRGMYATSTNGTTWGNFEMVLNRNCQGIYDSAGAGLGVFVIDDDGVDRMWHSGYDSTNWRIMYSTYWKNPAQDVWASDYHLVHHMNRDPSPPARNIYDSTSNTRHSYNWAGTMTPVDVVDGKIGKATEFDGSDDMLIMRDTIDNNFTFGAWIKATTTHQIDSQSNSGTAGVSGQRYAFGGANYILQVGLSVGTNGISVYEHDSGYMPATAVYNATIGSDWNHIMVVYTSLVPTIYLNGVPVHTGVVSAKSTMNNPRQIGGDAAYGCFPGQMDEVRIMTTNKSAAFIKASYFNEIDNFVIYQDDVPAGWLTDWAKRIPLTIDYTKIDTTLEEFPVCLTLASGTNTADMFTELGTVSGTQKIAVTTYNGITQCSVEIEYWDWDAQEAILWTKVPVVDEDVDTTLYLYYDSTKSNNTTYVGATGSLVAQDVWDDNFMAVYHMSQDPLGGASSLINSASLLNYGTPTGWDVTSNAALSKTCAQYTDDLGFPAGNAVDGNTSNFQSTNSAGIGHWWKVDLGAIYNLDSIRMWKRSGYGTRPNYYYIQTADDWAFTTNVTNIITENNETSSGSWVTWDTTDFGTISTRYVRVLTHTNSQYINISEFEVYVYGDALVDGKIAEALSFDGGDDEMGLGTNSSLDMTDAHTYEAIFKTSTAVSQDLVTKTDSLGSQHKMELHINSTGSVASNPYESTTNSNCNTDNGLGGNYIDGNYHYVATGIDTVYGDGCNRLYMDGVLNVTATTSISTINSQSTVAAMIGYRDDATGIYMNGIIDEVRISDVDRSASWIKATYYSSWNQLITYSAPETPPVDPTHYYYGYVTLDGVPAARTVNLHYRDTGALMGSTTSNASSGYYYLTTTISGEHYVVTLDDEEGLDYNALILDKLLPRGIE